jgi:DNA-directed RNA polymerase subunit RPC12/RpoP
MALPLIPHSEIESDCCGCLCQVVGETTFFQCNECGAIVSTEEAARLVLEMESCAATCPHCGRMNEISWFSEVFAFRCRFCGEAVTLS